MTIRDNPLFWSFSCGTCFLTRVRVSFYLPLLVFIVSFQLWDFQLGLVIGGLLFLSLVIHEYAHILAARFTGGIGTEILIWPLGGLAYLQPGPSKKSHFLVALSGPVVNLLLAMLFLPATMNSGLLSTSLNPLLFPELNLAGDYLIKLQVILFNINWLLFLVNLLPVYPLDGSKVIQAYFYRDWDQSAVQLHIMATGIIITGLGMVLGLAFSHVWLVFVSAILLLLNFYEVGQIRNGENEYGLYLEYEFPDSFTDNEGSDENENWESPRPGAIARWKERREEKKKLVNQQQEKENEILTDQILEKVHKYGLKSLSAEEKRVLDKASDRLKKRTSHPDDNL